MTILLTVALQTITVVMSDSRRIAGSGIVSDSATKLISVSDSLAFGVAGAEIGANLAEAILRDGGLRAAPKGSDALNGTQGN